MKLFKYENITFKELLFQDQDTRIIPIKPYKVEDMILGYERIYTGVQKEKVRTYLCIILSSLVFCQLL